MNDKERLEEIKNSYLEGLHGLFGTSWVSMPKENFDWLIKQAERAQKNAQDLEDMDKQLASEQERIEKLEKDLNALHYVYNLQAERVEELEEFKRNAERMYKYYHISAKKSVEEKERYKQALEFYADEETYEPLEVQIGAVTKEGYKISKYKYEPIINTDKGKKARQALKGETK